MARRKLRFAAGITVVVAAVAFFAISGFQEGKAYYRTLEELEAMGPTVTGQRLRVAGIVADSSVVRRGAVVTFILEQETRRLAVRYVGSQPIPDTFKDGVEAVVEGKRGPDGTFEADRIQAKCASKYEARYGNPKHASD